MKPGHLYLPVSVDFWEDPDTIAIGELSAVMYLRLAAYAKKHLTDGWVPMTYVRQVGGRRWRKKFEAIVCQGWITLTDKVDPPCATKWAQIASQSGLDVAAVMDAKWCHIASFLAWNSSADEIEQRREIAREKKRKQRKTRPDVPRGQVGDVPAAVPALSPPPKSESESISPKGESGARTTLPSLPRPHALDFQGEPARQAVEALSAATVSAGGVPKTLGGFNEQTAWAQAACNASELANGLGKTVSEVLATSARGFIAQKGTKASPAWWHERFSEYYEAGLEVPEAQPELTQLEARRDKLIERQQFAPVDQKQEIEAELQRLARRVRELKRGAA